MEHSERVLSCGHRAHVHGVLSRGAREPFALPGTIARFAPDRTADVRHTRLEVRLDPRRRFLEGTVRHTLSALDDGIETVTLHADELDVNGVTDGDGTPLAFSHQGGRLTITLDEPLALGRETTVVVAYEAEIVGLLFPVLAQRSDRLNVSVVRDGARRTSAKTLQPNPFAAANVNECVANRRKAGAERLDELFGGKLCGGV